MISTSMNKKKQRQQGERWVFRMAECEGPFFLLALGKAYEIHHVCNVSSSGMAIDMPNGFPVGEKIIVTYETKDTMLSVRGVIRWCKEEKNSVYRFGIEFDKNNQKSKRLLLSSLESYRVPFSNNIFHESRNNERKNFRTAVCEGPFFLIVSGKTYEISVVFDISTGGIGMEMPKAFNVGDEVIVVYETKDLLHHVKGNVAWCAQNSGNKSYRFGVVFASDDEKRKSLLLFSLKSYYESLNNEEKLPVETGEKRSHKRHEYFFTECQYGFILKLDNNDYPITSVRNISSSGMEIEMSSHSFEVGAEVDIVHVDNEKKTTVRGTIAWVQCLLDSSYCRFGVKFLDGTSSANSDLYLALKSNLDTINTPPS